MFPSVSVFLRAARSTALREETGRYLESRGSWLRAILEAGRFTIHDVINDGEVRAAVREQWRLRRVLEEDHAIEGYIAWLEYLEASSRGELPRNPRPRRSLFSL